MIWEILLLAFGLALLGLGAQWLVDSAAQIAVHLGVRTFVVGLTIVAFGTSAPEFMLSVMSSLSGENAFVLSNVIGSNIANITYVLGIYAIMAPLAIALTIEKREAWFMAAAVILLTLLALDGTISASDGVLMLVAFLFYLVLLVRALIVCAPDSNICTEFDEAIPVTRRPWKNVAIIIAGLVALTVGVEATVTGASSIARQFGVSDFLIGLTVIAIGTCLPEVATAATAARRKESDIVMGNALGSLIFNSLVVVGAGVLFQPIAVTEIQIWTGLLPLVLLSPIVLLISRSKKGLGRKEGVALLLIYAVFIGVAIAFNQ
ncbi:calcium/sodium antiporter [Methanomassiliicoccus luminyensis]|uniref:calcium/sodium antiporter n=1 Tax=Methanomassiliicoccus luminyensis TaxID=1080712 RepID=UPI0003726206|nr:calcium/sodium antiporter [Methanomassiliicoccus luminyensis]